jgi:hypothetical protein
MYFGVQSGIGVIVLHFTLLVGLRSLQHLKLFAKHMKRSLAAPALRSEPGVAYNVNVKAARDLAGV